MTLTLTEANVAAEVVRSTPKPAQGTVISRPSAFPVARVDTLDPRNAATLTLEKFLRAAIFTRGGGQSPQKAFRLNGIQHVWPDRQTELCYPAVSIVDAEPQMYATRQPEALEDTWNLFEQDTVLWKMAEMQFDLQVDYWATDDATREAFAAGVHVIFNPNESRDGIIVQGDPRYYDRPVRFTLLSVERIDENMTAFQNERRLRTVVRTEIDVVHLRCVNALMPQVTLVVDPIGE